MKKNSKRTLKYPKHYSKHREKIPHNPKNGNGTNFTREK